MHPDTAIIHRRVGQTAFREHSAPLFLTSSFTFENARHGQELFSGRGEGLLYSRFDNPNTDEFIQRLAALEGCEDGVSTASGMAAIFSVFAALLKPGDHVIASRELFGNTSWVLDEWLPQQGVQVDRVAVDQPAEFEAAFAPVTRLVFVESPSNPLLKLADIESLAERCRKHGALLAVDNCFATPILQQPAKWGADIIVHSATKYIDGQGRALGGAILGKSDVIAPFREFLRRTGACLSPFNAWLLSRSLETLSMRMEKHSSNALAVAQFLASHPAVEAVVYPGLEQFPQAELSRKYLRAGGGLVGFKLKSGDPMALLDALSLFSLTANLGDSRSIATHPASTTHSRLSVEQRLQAGISESYLRLSIGLEHAPDLIKDLAQAIQSCQS